MKSILIELKAVDNASVNINKTTQAVTNLGKQSTASMKQTSHAATDVMGQLDALGNRFRYMSIVLGVISAGSVMAMKSFVDAATEAQQAFLKLGVFAVSVGEDMNEVNKVAQDLAGTGLISVSEAAEGLANFLATGLGLEKAKTLMYTFLDSASVAKESLTDTLGQALIKTSLGFRTFREVQIDASGINTQLNKVYTEYAKTLDTTANKLSNTQKYQAMYNFYTQEGTRFIGAADLVQQTFVGSLAKLNAQFYQMKIALGESLVPLIGTLSEALTWVTGKVTAFAKSSSAMTSIILVGVTALAALGAAIVMVGAMLPLLVSGFAVLNWAAIAPMIIAGAKVALIFAAISVAIGGLVYLALKATGQWDKWKNSMSNLADRIKAIINPFKVLGNTVAEEDKKIAKQLKILQQNINLASRDFTESMGEWARKHDETVKDLRSQITDLQKDYAKATAKIREDFNKTMSDLSLSHARKTEDLQRDIDEEVSKGIWGDQTRIRELKLELKRENEDYAISTQDKAAIRDEDLTNEQEKNAKSLTELQKKLDDELKLEQDHATLVAAARAFPILDEIEKTTRAYNERLAQYKDELLEIQKTAAGTADAVDDTMVPSFDNLTGAISGANDQVKDLGKNATDSINAIPTFAYNAGNAIRDWLGGALQFVIDKFKELQKHKTDLDFLLPRIKEPGTSISGFFKGLLGFQEGGVIPGMPSQPVPIIAHGGETVVPYGMSPITININNPSVRQASDIQLIANTVKEMLSRQQYLRHLK